VEIANIAFPKSQSFSGFKSREAIWQEIPVILGSDEIQERGHSTYSRNLEHDVSF